MAVPDFAQGDAGLGRLEDVEVTAASFAPSVEPVPAEQTMSTFADLYTTAFGDMVRLAYLLTSSTETARDLVQDAFLRVHGAWGRIQEPRAYLRRAVVNACHSHHRRVLRQRRHARSERVEHAGLDADEMFDAIAALPYRQRTAVVLRYWHDCTEAEIANALGCRPGTVGSLLHRARAELRRVMT